MKNGKKQIAIGLVSNISPTVTTRSGASSLCNFGGAGHFPMLGILIIDEVSNPDKLSQRTLPHTDEPRL